MLAMSTRNREQTAEAMRVQQFLKEAHGFRNLFEMKKKLVSYVGKFKSPKDITKGRFPRREVKSIRF